MVKGSRIHSGWLRYVIQNNIKKREPLEEVIIHHYTDTKDYIQLEVERRSMSLGIKFERIIFR